MKVAINFRQRSGPWGGGNRFLVSLVTALKERGDTVCYELNEDDIDLILLMDPRWRHPSLTFTPGAILRYLLFQNSNCLVVHRINECDERKNTSSMNLKLRRANYVADHTVFVGAWLQQLNLWDFGSGKSTSIITNGADTSIFNANGWKPWGGSGPLKLVTHHWGGNWMKGFDIYQRLDEMMADPIWCKRIHLTYIGNLPKNFSFKNVRYLSPLDGVELANELRSHHAYITASINEPGGNHQNEGALVGLPLFYRRSGCLPEYCGGYGIDFDEIDFVGRLQEFITRYEELVRAMPSYPHTATQTTKKYLTLFDSLMSSRENIIKGRRIFRNPWLLFRNQIPF